MPNSYVEITSNGSASQTLAFSFPYLNQTDIGVTVDGVTQTLTTHWSFATTQSIVFVSHPANGAVIRISRTTPSATRVVDFQDGSVLSEADLDNSADQIFFIAQEAADTAAQSIILDTDGKWEAQSKPIKNVTNPTNAQDAVTKNYLENTWLSTSDKTQLNNLNTTNLNTVAGSVSNVNTVAGAITNVNTVAGKATEITALATTDNVSNMDTLAASGVVGNIASVAGISSDVTTVAGKASLITSDFVSDLNTVAVTDVINDINTLATSDIVSDLNTLATSDIVSDLNTLATSDIVSDVNLLATSDIVSDLNQLATSDFVSDLNQLATTTNVNNLGTVAGAIGNVNSVGSSIGNVNTVAGISSAVSTVAADATDIGNVSGSIANVNTVATNISGVNSFAEQYRTGSSDPTTSLNEGDLFYNTTANQLKIYNGTQWENAAPAGSGFLATSGGTMTGNLVVNATITASELTVDGGVLSVDASSNRVGVNQNSPSTDLHVSHSANNTATLTPSVVQNLGLRIKGDNASNTTGNIYSGISLGEGYAGIYGYDGGSSAATGFGVFTGTNADVDKRITVDANGDISFYDTSENAKLLWDASATALNVTGTVQADQFNNDEALPDIRPSLLLDFANSKTLDPRITFTRGSTATYWDGVTTAKAEENLIKYSQDFTNTWLTGNVTVTGNNATAPDGTTSADKIQAGTNTNQFYFVYQRVAAQVSTVYTATIYFKAGTNDYARFDVQQRNGGSYVDTVSYIGVNLTNGATIVSGGSGGSKTFTITDVGSGWYRATATFTSSASGFDEFEVEALLANSSGDTQHSISGSKDIFVWGAQLEQRSSATAYTATTSATIVKYQPTLQTAASGEARFDHDPVTGESKGLLIEEARTNLVPYSEDFVAGWTLGSGASKVADWIAPNGTNTGSVIQIGTDGTSPNETVTVSSSTAYAFSFYLKQSLTTASYLRIRFSAAAGSYSAYINPATLEFSNINSAITNTSTEDVGNGVYRVSGVITFGASDGGSRTIAIAGVTASGGGTADTGKDLAFWGFQVEAGSFATSYIATAGSTVTRAVDAAAITGSNFNFFSNQQGSLYAETEIFDVYKGTDIFPRTIAFVGDDANQDHIAFYHQMTSSTQQTNSSVLRSGTTYASNILQNAMADGFIKVAISFANDDIAAVANNGTGVVTDTSAVLPDITELRIFGSVRYQPAPNGYIKKVAYYPKRLSNATLQAMTTE